jgi:hypothetical protein
MKKFFKNLFSIIKSYKLPLICICLLVLILILTPFLKQINDAKNINQKKSELANTNNPKSSLNIPNKEFENKTTEKNAPKENPEYRPKEDENINYPWVIIDSQEKHEFPTNKSLITKDPYKDIWETETSPGIYRYRPFLARFYKDLDKDGIPELFISWSGGSGGNNYVIYKITKGDYYYLGNIFIYNLQILTTYHYGMQDLIAFWRLGAYEDGSLDGALTLYQFDGTKYKEIKYKNTSLNYAMKNNIFKPDDINIEKHPNTDNSNPDKLQWSPKDDDKYRNLIK